MINKPERTTSLRNQLVIILFAAATFLVGCISPPHLMDDVDATQSEIAKTMLQTGNWVTARLDGVVYLEKAPLKYWITASMYAIFGVHDWVARVPNALAVIFLCLLVYRMAVWAGREQAGFYAGLVLSTSIGLFLFTRIVIPDVILTLAITLALWCFFRTVEDERPGPGWAFGFYVALAAGVLLKGLIGLVFPLGTAFFYLLLTGRLRSAPVWKRMRVGRGILLFLVLAAPWHILAILQNPPYFDLTLHADPHFGHHFHGFFWFYFINDQFLRFTNGRWPRDYNTVPRIWFWLYHIVWFFPWFLFLCGWKGVSLAGDVRSRRLSLLCVIWIGLVMAFFTLSTTQEYYSMPIYPALALIIGFAMTSQTGAIRVAAGVASVVTGLAGVICLFLLFRSWGFPTPGDISNALTTQDPDAYTLSLGHMGDLTFAAFAYLRVPLLLAAIAFVIGTACLWLRNRVRMYLGIALMLVIFFQAARLALVTFDPYLSSYPVAASLRNLPHGRLIFNGQYYAFSSIPFYTGLQPLLLNGRVNNLEFGSYAPNAPQVFPDNAELIDLWGKPERSYIVSYVQDRNALERLVGKDRLYSVATSGGKLLLTNHSLNGNSR